MQFSVTKYVKLRSISHPGIAGSRGTRFGPSVGHQLPQSPKILKAREGLPTVPRISLRRGGREVMNDELDRQLSKLAAEKAPPTLASIDALVLARVAGHRFTSSESLFRLGLLAGLVALAMGILGGVVPGPRESDVGLTQLVDTSEIAPSSLLAGDQ